MAMNEKVHELDGSFKALRAIINVEGEEAIRDYTGRFTKTLVFTIHKDVRFIHGFRGMLSPLHLSPPFTVKGDFMLGEYTGPSYTRKGESGERKLVPYRFKGKYIIHLGGLKPYVDGVEEALRMYERRGSELALKFDNSLHFVSVEAVKDVSRDILGKELEGDTVTVYLKAPAMIFNVYAKTRLPKFSPTAVELLMTPFLYLAGNPTHSPSSLVEASSVLGYMVESMYSLNTLRPVFVPFRGKKEAALSGRAKYILDLPENNGKKEEVREIIRKVLALGEILGIGESRMNGFGTITFSSRN